MLYIELILRKKPIFNIKFGYVNDIIILRINLITFYTVTILIINVKNILKKNNVLSFNLIKYKLKYFYKNKIFKTETVVNGTFKVKTLKNLIR